MKIFVVFYIGLIFIGVLSGQRNPGFLERKNVLEVGTSINPIGGYFKKELSTIKFSAERTLTRTLGFELGYKSVKFNQVDSSIYDVKYNGDYRLFKIYGNYTYGIKQWHAALNLYFTNYGAIAPRGLYFKIGVRSITTQLTDGDFKMFQKDFYNTSFYEVNAKSENKKLNTILPYAGFGIRKIAFKRIGINYNFLFMPVLNVNSSQSSLNKVFNYINFEKYTKSNYISFNIGLSYIFGIKKSK